MVIHWWGVEHKMVSMLPTCVMNLEDATGYLVGEPNQGMRAMFVMMNLRAEGIALLNRYQTASKHVKTVVRAAR